MSWGIKMLIILQAGIARQYNQSDCWVKADMKKFTFQHWGIAFHWAVLTSTKNVEARTKGKVRDTGRGGLCARRWPFLETHTGRKCSWLSLGGKMWPQTRRAGGAHLRERLQRPARWVTACGRLWKLGKTSRLQMLVLACGEPWTWKKVYQATKVFLYFTLM